MIMTILKTLLWIVPLIFMILFIKGYIQAMFTPDSWREFLKCIFRGHDFSDSYWTERDGDKRKLKTCENCGVDRNAIPPEPLVP